MSEASPGRRDEVNHELVSSKNTCGFRGCPAPHRRRGAALYKFWPNNLGDPARTPLGEQPLVLPDKPVSVPFIFWGGDVATFHANGQLETQPNTIFNKLGLKFTLTPGDDFKEQVKNYLSGKSPFLAKRHPEYARSGFRSAYRQTRKYDPRCVSPDDVVGRRSSCRTGSLRDYTQRPQRQEDCLARERSPHVGMLNDILNTAKLQWSDIKVVLGPRPELTGDKGPAELFRKDPSIDARFGVTPDMERSVRWPGRCRHWARRSPSKGAHVVVYRRLSA